MTDDALRRYELAVWEALAGARPDAAPPPRPDRPAADAARRDLERIWAAAARSPSDVWVGALGARDLPRA